MGIMKVDKVQSCLFKGTAPVTSSCIFLFIVIFLHCEESDYEISNFVVEKWKNKFLTSVSLLIYLEKYRVSFTLAGFSNWSALTFG